MAVTGRLSVHAQVRTFLYSDFVWDAADGIDAALPVDPNVGGRPRAYPMVCALIWCGLVSVFGSSRQVEVELGCTSSPWWLMVRQAAAEMRPELSIPERPMKRHHYEWLREQYLVSDRGLEIVSESFTRVAAAQAQNIGLCDPEGGGSLTHPSRDRVVAGDGKVVTPRYKTHPRNQRQVNKETGEIREKHVDPDADLHVTGGGERVFGTKFVLTSGRGDERNRRIVLDVIHSGSGGEAKWAIKSLHRTLPLLPGAQAVVYDGAFRGTHLRELIKQHGVVPISRLHSGQHGSVPDRHLGTVEVSGGTRDTVDIHLVNGSPCVRTFNVEGEPITTPLTRVQTQRRRNLDGWRLYNLYEVPSEHGGGTIRLRVDQTTDDAAKGFNREEHLRVIPPDDPDHDELYGRRNDTESGNRLLDDSMLRERAHTVGRRRQLLDVISWAAVRNASAAAQHCRRNCADLGPPLAA